MIELELEKTYLLKEIPKGLFDCKFKEILDIYIPESDRHPVLRIRQKGDKFEMTKKFAVDGEDASAHNEHTISLSKEEFAGLQSTPGKRLHKYRYYYDHRGHQAEIDIFKDDLSGLVLADFEFTSKADFDAFKMPDFCLAEITLDENIAGGILAGKKYADIEPILNKYNYKKLIS